VDQRREELRAADVDREFVAEQLKGALSEGRLSLLEYDERLQEAYAARTYGDLDKVLADLPGVVPVQRSQLASVTPSAAASPAGVGGHHADESPEAKKLAVRRWMVVAWGAWLSSVLVTFVIWGVTWVASGDIPYPWPLWVAGPWGAVLVAGSISALVSGEPPDDRHKRRDRRRRDRHGH
jgi:hypothetical protein